MRSLQQDEFDGLLKQHQLYAYSLGNMGERLRINKFNLSKLEIKHTTLTDSFMTESLFCDNQIEDVEIFDANLCGCEFNNVIFNNVHFVKTDLSYCLFKNCKFVNAKIQRCESDETTFKNVQFISCELYDTFSYSLLENVLFSDMNLKSLDFYNVLVKNIRMRNIKEFRSDKSIISINIGDFQNEHILTGEKAMEYFQKKCIFE